MVIFQNTKFKIVIPSYNCPKWIGKCLKSIEEQKYKNFEVCVIDDNSIERDNAIIIKDYCLKNNWKYIINENRKYTLYNIENGIKELKCNNDDVILTIDGDDWLINDGVLNLLDEYYCNNDIYLTYGQHIRSISKETSLFFSFMPNKDTIKIKSYRKNPWAFTQLRSFKYMLYKNINKRHFLDSLGRYFTTACDLALMFPMVEMCGDKFKCIEEILYVYNEENPLSDYKINKNRQAIDDMTIRRFPIYPTIVK